MAKSPANDGKQWTQKIMGCEEAARFSSALATIYFGLTPPFCPAVYTTFIVLFKNDNIIIFTVILILLPQMGHFIEA
jgi:hypothetical protein